MTIRVEQGKGGQDRYLGHGHISATTRYVHLARHTAIGPDSPLDLLARFAPPPQG